MGIIIRMLKQKAVYWALQSGAAAFDTFGQPQYENPIEIDVRWEVKTEEFLGPNGTLETSNAVVYVGQDVEVGGVLMLGELTDIDSSLTVPKQNDEAYEIRRFEKLPNLRNTKVLRTVYM